MALLKKLFGKDRPSAEEQQEETDQLVRQLAEARRLLFAVERRRAEFILEEDAPMQLSLEEDRLHNRIAELENRCIALGVEPVEDALARKEHLTDLLAKARENLLFIQEEVRERGTDVPMQLAKAEQRWRNRIAKLENELDEG